MMTTLHQWGEPVPSGSTGRVPINCKQALGQLDEFVVYTPLALARCLGRVATLRSLYIIGKESPRGQVRRALPDR